MNSSLPMRRSICTCLTGLLLAACAAEPPPFGDRVLRAEPLLLGPVPTAIPVPAGGIRSGGGFDAVCLELAPGWSLLTDQRAGGCRAAGPNGSQAAVRARFAVAGGGHFTPQTCHQTRRAGVDGAVEVALCFRNPGLPRGEFVYLGIDLSAEPALPLRSVRWRDAPGGPGQPSPW